MDYKQLILPGSKAYQQKTIALFARVKALDHPDITRSMRGITEAACLFVRPDQGPSFIKLSKKYKLNQPPRNGPPLKYHTGSCKIDIRCWREARLTAAKIAISYNSNLKTRDIVCLSLLLVGELTEQQLTELLLALSAQKTALLEKQI